MFLKHTKWALLWALVILILCGIPGKDIPHISFLELLNFDKFVHASIFVVLAALTIRGFQVQTSVDMLNRYPKATAVSLCILYGGLLEIMQGTLFDSRSADPLDFVANSFGCFVALILYPQMNNYFLRRFIN
jgi:VanZ family protein